MRPDDESSLTAVPHADAYAVAAEYYDLWSGSYWDELGPALRAALADVDPANGPVVELGAGTGLGTVLIADTVDRARVIAVEPSRAMRGVLVSRIASRADLHERVTVLPFDLAHTSWPRWISGFVAMAMLGHLGPDERAKLWRMLSDRLGPGAPAIVHLQPPSRPAPVLLARHSECRLGELTYEGWSEAQPAGDTVLSWTMTYRVLRGKDLLDEQRWTSDFHTVGEGDIRHEAGAAGLEVSAGAAGLVILRRTTTG